MEDQKKRNRLTLPLLKTVLVRTLPILTGYVVLGIGFGVLLANAGYSWIWAFFMSLTILSGTMQYLGVSLLASGASVISTAIMALAVNARYIFYGISSIERYKGAGWMKPYLIHTLTDENFALICSTDPPEGVDPHFYAFIVSLFDQSYWIIGSVLGALMGKSLPFDSTGIEFVMTTLFATVVVDQWKEEKNHIPVLCGLGLAAASLVIFGPEKFLIPALIGITLALSLGRRWIDGR
ncbi:MAG: AzlC family ABC transporter permease [Firmicutes bacterium]|nr:AzlC family ABC transporter permease [Bacillota bacterium]